MQDVAQFKAFLRPAEPVTTAELVRFLKKRGARSLIASNGESVRTAQNRALGGWVTWRTDAAGRTIGNPEESITEDVAALRHWRAAQALLETDERHCWVLEMVRTHPFGWEACEAALDAFKGCFHAAECFLVVCAELGAEPGKALAHLKACLPLPVRKGCTLRKGEGV